MPFSMEYISISISFVALVVSGLTFWLTRIKTGVVKMTRPTIIYFGPDGGDNGQKKVFIRTLLFSTSDKGNYVQNMYVRLQKGESVQNFNIWVYGEKGRLSRGSGLFVNKRGISHDHHFLLPKDSSDYKFTSGEYFLEIYVECINEQPRKIFSQHLTISNAQQDEMTNWNIGIYFDWAPNTQNYFSGVDSNPRKDDEKFRESFRENL